MNNFWKYFNKTLVIIFLSSLLFDNIHSYYVLPLKTSYDYDSKDTDQTRIMHNFITNNIYTELDIGDPSQKLSTFIRSKEYCSYIGSYLCHIENSKYNSSESKNFINTTPYNLNFKEFKNVCLANEKMKLYSDYNDLSNLLEVNFSQFYHAPNNTYSSENPNTCGIFGFRNKFDETQEGENKCLSLINSLYNKNNTNFFLQDDIQNLVFSIKYNNDNSDDVGKLIIGSYPHEYDPKIYEEKYYEEVYLNESSLEKNNYFYTTFYDIYFYKNNKEEIDNKVSIKEVNLLHSIFIVEQNMIMVPQQFYNLYKNNFFKKYLDTEVCAEVTTDLGKYTSIICEKSQIKNNTDFYDTFPSIFFFHFGFNKTFEFTKEELLVEDKEKIYLMIYVDINNNNNFWGIGKLFMKKYMFTFDFGKQSIGFYSQTNEKERKEFDFFENGIYVIIILGANILVAFSCLLYCIIHKCTKSKVDPTIMIESFSAMNNENLAEKQAEEKVEL